MRSLEFVYILIFDLDVLNKLCLTTTKILNLDMCPDERIGSLKKEGL